MLFMLFKNMWLVKMCGDEKTPGQTERCMLNRLIIIIKKQTKDESNEPVPYTTWPVTITIVKPPFSSYHICTVCIRADQKCEAAFKVVVQRRIIILMPRNTWTCSVGNYYDVEYLVRPELKKCENSEPRSSGKKHCRADDLKSAEKFLSASLRGGDVEEATGFESRFWKLGLNSS